MDRDEDENEEEEEEEEENYDELDGPGVAMQTLFDVGSAFVWPADLFDNGSADQVVTQHRLHVPGRPAVHWAEPIHTEGPTTRNIERENIAIEQNSQANAITIPDAELVRRTEENNIYQLFSRRAEIRRFPARCFHENDHIRVHGRSCEITSIIVNPVIVRITVDLMEDGYTLEVRPSHQIAVSAAPIPDDAIISSSAAMLVARDYTFLRDRPCMLTRVTAPRLHDVAREMHVFGVDLETGEAMEATLGEDTIVPIASKPVGKFVPSSLLGPRVARVAAASVMEGYYMVIEGRACKVVCVKYPERPCEEWCWRRVRVVGMDILSSTTDSKVFRGFDVDMDSMVTVGRHGIDPGPCDFMGGGNILGHMSAANDLFNNVSF